jgi:hypothetical protein
MERYAPIDGLYHPKIQPEPLPSATCSLEWSRWRGRKTGPESDRNRTEIGPFFESRSGRRVTGGARPNHGPTRHSRGWSGPKGPIPTYQLLRRLHALWLWQTMLVSMFVTMILNRGPDVKRGMRVSLRLKPEFGFSACWDAGGWRTLQRSLTTQPHFYWRGRGLLALLSANEAERFGGSQAGRAMPKA